MMNPGVIYDYDVIIIGKNPYNKYNKAKLTIYREDGSNGTKNIISGDIKEHSLSYNADMPNIVKIKYEKKWLLGAEQEGEEV